MPAYQGLFIDSLAKNVEHLFCFFHTTSDPQNADYELLSLNVTIVSLGQDRPAYEKIFLPGVFFNKEVLSVMTICDKLLIRGPSALLHHFPKLVNNNKIIYLIVGSFKEGCKNIKIRSPREVIIKILNAYLAKQEQIALRYSRVLVNSNVLKEELSGYVNRIEIIHTTTLKASDLYLRTDTCNSTEIKLIYVGRIDWAKGIKELLEAFVIVNQRLERFELHFIGWEEKPTRPIQKLVERWAEKNNFLNKIYFHGKKPAGSELFQYYQMGDIYILPSYHEGFPRTIWESMANSVPVIATKVGSIPDYLTHLEDAYLIPPHNSNALANAILELATNSVLRKQLIKGGINRVKDITLDIQAKKIIDFIEND